MYTIKRSIIIDARLDKVFDFVSNPNHLPEVWPNFIEVGNLTQSKVNGGYDYDWVYEMEDTRLKGRAETIDFEQYHRLVVQGIKETDSWCIWMLEPHGGKGTRLIFELKYMPAESPTEKKSMEKMEAENLQQVEEMLENLKQGVEQEVVYSAA